MSITDLPALGQPLDGGVFAGIITRQDGTHCAVVLLPDNGTDLTWAKAKTWAKQQGGELPSRPVAALLFANKANLKPKWHWTSEEYDASYAWLCSFSVGTQYYTLKCFEGSAVAVRLIPISS